MGFSYAERDYAFGQAMLTLRSTIGLTQAGLAKHLCISRRAVGEWEAGGSYPKAEHLKELIALAVQKQVFTAGQEAEEIRRFWKGARQKVLLDEYWLSTLLSERPSSLKQVRKIHIVPSHLTTCDSTPIPKSMISTPVMPSMEQSGEYLLAPQPLRSGPRAPAAGPQVDWDEALALSRFYGREQEQAQLTQWVLHGRSCLISVLGMGGIGKSALVANIMYQLAEHFEVVIFRSLRNAPSCEALLDDCLQVFCPQPSSTVLASLEQRISLLLSYLRQTRTLLVLDNLEVLLSEGDVRGHFRPGFEGYGKLLRRVAETAHQSCLLLTSREKPAELRAMEGKHSPVCSLRLAGLDVASCKQLFQEKELIGTDQEQERLIEIYGGNPLALKMVSATIVDLFAGEIGLFLSEDVVLFGGISELLGEQFARLSALEQSVLRWLAIVREPVTLDELLALQVTPLSRVQVLEAVDAGYRRSLIERKKCQGSFTLQSLMLEYVTSVLIAEATDEIQQGRLDRLIAHSLEQAHVKEYVRQAQERLLVRPLLVNLKSVYQRRIDIAPRDSTLKFVVTPRDSDLVEERLLSLLDHLREEHGTVQGYGPANLIALLRLQRGHLSGLDLSHLFIRDACLQGVEMCDTNLSGAQMCESVLTESVCAALAVAVSPDGRLWAVGGIQGSVCVWKGVRCQTLHFVWQAHSDLVQALAFSPDGRTLASVSLDGTIKLWNLEACSHGAGPHDALLWMGWQNSPRSLAFSPDASLLVSGGLDGTVRIWDPQNGKNLQTLEHASPVLAVAFSPDGGLLASGCFDGEMRLWERRKTLPSTGIEILRLLASWVTGPTASLAFAPDGRTLASAHWDRTIKLWGVGSLRLLQTLSGQMKQVNRVAWSPDGRTLASGGSGKTICLWDVEQGRYRAVLHGHTSDIHDIAFTPDSSCLFSSSADSTLRVWDVQSGECMRVIDGYSVCLYDIDWSPDGTQLVSGGFDGQVTIWDVSGETPSRVSYNHNGIVRGVGWSPDGRFLASCGWDRIIRLWNPISGVCVQMLEDRLAMLESMAWSPNGRLLACGSYLGGMQVWDVKARNLLWVGQMHMVAFSHVAWSPDGTRLVGGGDDGNLHLWETGDSRDVGTAACPCPPLRVAMRLSGHHGKITSVGWSPDGTRLASSSSNGGKGELFVWDVQSVAAGAGQGLLGVGSAQGMIPTASILSATRDQPWRSARPVQTFVGHSGVVSALAWCRRWTDTVEAVQGSCVEQSVGQGLRTTNPLWSSSGQERRDSGRIGQAPVRPLSAPTGLSEDLLVSGGSNGLLSWWDVQSGECVSMRAAHQGTIRSLRVSPDGRWLASCGDDGAIMIWDLGSFEHLRTLRRDRPYERLKISGIRGLTQAEIATLQALGAVEEEASSVTGYPPLARGVETASG